MISRPSKKFILLSAFLIPLAGLASFNSTFLTICIISYFVVGCIAFWDKKRSYRQLPIPRLEAIESQHCTINSPSILKISINKNKLPINFQLGISWDSVIEASPTINVRLSHGEQVSEEPLLVHWKFLATQRGKYSINELHYQTSSSLGLWDIQTVIPCDLDIKAYPNIREDKKFFQQLLSNTMREGAHINPSIGKGREFEKLRPYAHGDTLQDIHWKSSAKRGELVTKEYRTERSQNIYFIIDSSRLSLTCPSPREHKRLLDLYVQSVSLLSLHTEQTGDLFGLISFSSFVDQYLPARTGRTHRKSVQEALYNLQGKKVTPDIEEVMTYIRNTIKKRSILIFLTDLRDPLVAESILDNIDLVRSRHKIVLGMLTPKHLQPLFSEPVESREDIYAALSAHNQWDSIKREKNKLTQKGIHFASANCENFTSALYKQISLIKRRQLL